MNTFDKVVQHIDDAARLLFDPGKPVPNDQFEIAVKVPNSDMPYK